MIERRELERFKTELPVGVSENRNGNYNIMLKTLDISSRGAFIGTDTPSPVGTRLEIDIFLLSDSGGRDDIIRTNGKVVRTAPGGMAVRFDDEYRILPIEYCSKQ